LSSKGFEVIMFKFRSWTVFGGVRERDSRYCVRYPFSYCGVGVMKRAHLILDKRNGKRIMEYTFS